MVKKDITSSIVIENRTNLASHPYCIVFNIQKWYLLSEKFLHKAKVVNLYENKVGKTQL